jgi:flagellar hook-basal body complex protein FliE
MMNQINPVGPLQEGGASQQAARIGKTGQAGQPSFKETLSNFLSEVNTMQNKADESIQKMVAGEITDVHQVMNSVQEATVAFNMMMEIRNKVMDAYRQVMQMRL